MKLKKKAGLLAAGMLMLGTFYGPQASASDFPLGTIAALASYATTDSGSASAFTDTWDFQVSGNALLNDSQSATGVTGLYTQGVDITSVQLFDGASLIATGTLTQSLTVVPTIPALDITNYYDSLSNVALTVGQQYTLQVSGDYLGLAGGAYTGTLATSPAAISGVPLPSAAWFFLTATLGFLGLSRRKNSIG